MPWTGLSVVVGTLGATEGAGDLEPDLPLLLSESPTLSSMLVRLHLFFLSESVLGVLVCEDPPVGGTRSAEVDFVIVICHCQMYPNKVRLTL